MTQVIRVQVPAWAPIPCDYPPSLIEKGGLGMSTGVRLIPPEARTEGTATAGMAREEAVATGHMWAGLVRTAAGMVSGWHHHGAYETTIFVTSGALLMEFGPRGAESFEAKPGDFVYVARGAIHRESNPSDEEARIVVVRSGSGDPVINVDGPDVD
jgi:uncharacterized RmlC-like cupin family protein